MGNRAPTVLAAVPRRTTSRIASTMSQASAESITVSLRGLGAHTVFPARSSTRSIA